MTTARGKSKRTGQWLDGWGLRCLRASEAGCRAIVGMVELWYVGKGTAVIKEKCKLDNNQLVNIHNEA